MFTAMFSITLHTLPRLRIHSVHSNLPSYRQYLLYDTYPRLPNSISRSHKARFETRQDVAWILVRDPARDEEEYPLEHEDPCDRNSSILSQWDVALLEESTLRFYSSHTTKDSETTRYVIPRWTAVRSLHPRQDTKCTTFSSVLYSPIPQ